jgi:hypothetical protein
MSLELLRLQHAINRAFTVQKVLYHWSQGGQEGLERELGHADQLVDVLGKSIMART